MQNTPKSSPINHITKNFLKSTSLSPHKSPNTTNFIQKNIPNTTNFIQKNIEDISKKSPTKIDNLRTKITSIEEKYCNRSLFFEKGMIKKK